MSQLEPVKPREPSLPVSPQLALRVAIIGGLAMVMFGVIFFRLWYLQVLTGEKYVQQAAANQVRELPIAAPRGEVLDRNGQPLASSRTTNAVQIIPGLLPGDISAQAAVYQERLAVVEKHRLAAAAQLAQLRSEHPRGSRFSRGEALELHALQRAAALPHVPLPPLTARDAPLERLLRRLAPIIKLSPRTIDERVVHGMTATPWAKITVKTDAGAGALTVLGERQEEFPGVVQEPVAIREYPHGELAAQVLGHVDQISEPELTMKAFRGVKAGTVVGQEGLEFRYDRYLRGTPGIERIAVDAAGHPVPSEVAPTQPKAGETLKTTIDLGLQQEGERALREGIEHARAGAKPATGGGFVAIDPRNGQLLAMGSYPTFDPNKFAKPLTPSEYQALVGTDSEAGPLTDRAANGAYPTGSTFKPITAMAALEGGVITPEEGLGAGSCIFVSTEKFCNAGQADYGAVPLVEALKVSSDTYFFEVGERAYSHGTVIQREAERLGIGHTTGVDLPTELEGTVPGPAWRARENRLERACERERHLPSCGIVEEVRPWSVGDNMHLAVGQGELLTSPLQMAVAYSTLVNAYMHGGYGTVVTPHLGMEIDEPQGGLIESLRFPGRRVHLDYEDLRLVMQGIHEAASQPGGTSADVWQGWNQEQNPVYGKTGTAQHTGKEDQSWYMCYVADPTRPIVLAVTVEQGGFGAETAAPIARLMASEWFHKPLKFVSGKSHTL